ncbi:MAG: HAD-IIA family hydrolase [Actinomycetota bacterium]
MERQLIGWALDLDGVIWRGTETVPGSPEAVARLRAAEVPIAFVTNSAQRTPAQVAAKLASHGIDDAEHEVITAAMAAATLVAPGERVLTIGSDGLVQALETVGAEIVDRGPADTVAVGIDLTFDYDAMSRAMRAIQDGARFIATNTDATFPTADGLVPGNGALVAAVSTASGVVPQVAGKPHEPIAALVRDRLGPDGVMVGDRPETDGLFAEAVGYGFGLVFSGVTVPADLPVEPTPAYIAADLAAMVDMVLTS